MLALVGDSTTAESDPTFSATIAAWVLWVVDALGDELGTVRKDCVRNLLSSAGPESGNSMYAHFLNALLAEVDTFPLGSLNALVNLLVAEDSTLNTPVTDLMASTKPIQQVWIFYLGFRGSIILILGRRRRGKMIQCSHLKRDNESCGMHCCASRPLKQSRNPLIPAQLRLTRTRTKNFPPGGLESLSLVGFRVRLGLRSPYNSFEHSGVCMRSKRKHNATCKNNAILLTITHGQWIS